MAEDNRVLKIIERVLNFQSAHKQRQIKLNVTSVVINIAVVAGLIKRYLGPVDDVQCVVGICLLGRDAGQGLIAKAGDNRFAGGKREPVAGLAVDIGAGWAGIAPIGLQLFAHLVAVRQLVGEVGLAERVGLNDA